MKRWERGELKEKGTQKRGGNVDGGKEKEEEEWEK